MKAAVLVLTDQGLKTAQRIINEWPEGDLPELWVHRNYQGGSLRGFTLGPNQNEVLDLIVITKEPRKSAPCSSSELSLTSVEAREPSLSPCTDSSSMETGEPSPRFFRELKEVVPALWKECSVLVFIMATGIVVRHIAPLLKSKDMDPAILVLDEKGEFVIPLLSGHLGGANAWARKIANGIGAQPVLTTATDVRGLTAPDEYARQLEWAVEPVAQLRKVNRFLLDKGYLKVWSDYELPEQHPLCQDPHYRFLDESEKGKAHLWISVQKESNLGSSHDFANDDHPGDFDEAPLLLIPRVFSIGVGCRRGVSREQILEAVQVGLDQLGISRKSVQGIYSIELKANELGIREAAQALGVPFRTFSAEEVQAVNEERSLACSGFVREKIGVDGVCEATSLLGTKQGELVLPKQKLNGVTVAISQERFMS